MGVGSVCPRGGEVCLHFQLVVVRNYEPCADFLQKLIDGDAVVSQILFVQRFDVLLGDDGDNDLSVDLVKDPMVEVARPQPKLFLLKIEEVAAGFGHDSRIDKVGLCDRRAIQRGVCGEQPHFFFR